MGEEFSLNTNDYSVAKMAIAWEMTKYIIYHDEANIPANRVVDLFNMVVLGLNSVNLIDQEAFKKLHE